MSAVVLGFAAGPAQASFGVTMDAGADHTCAVLSGGAVKCWGNNGFGQLGDGTVASKATPTDVSGLSSGVSAVTAGRGHTCALLSTGAVKCWGNNYDGQLGDGTMDAKSTPTAVSGLSSGVSSITAGYGHTCALLSTGAVKCWGENDSGQLGDGTTDGKPTPTDVSGLSSGVSAITAGAGHTCALLSTGAVKCWGGNDFGQLGDGTTAIKETPTAVTGLSSGVSAITAGDFHSCALLSTGAAKCWGDNYDGQLGDGTTSGKSTPTNVSGLSSGVSAISAGGDGDHTCALLSTGAAKCWGDNYDGQLGDGTTVAKSTPTDVSGLSSGVSAITAGRGHTCALLSTGAAKCWGRNDSGQLGDGTVAVKSTPTDVSGLSSGVSAITAGRGHTCALLSTGAAKCWGDNGFGQLGDGTRARKETPTDVSGLSSGVSAISAGGDGDHTCALLSTGAVKCWGGNYVGQLGDGTTAPKATPTDVSGLSSGVSAITAGDFHTCALLATGAVKCWGGNGFGQLGDGTTDGKTTPTNVSGLSSGVSAITAGSSHTCALLSTGAVKCWGDNGLGQLGDGTTADKTTPTDVSGLSSGVSAITAGRYHTCALLSTGAAKCWGYNWSGQLGDGTTDDKTTPTDVSGLSSGVSAITAGYDHTCALLTTGAVKCWGGNDFGQLGDGTIAFKDTPTNVSGLSSGVSAITAGYGHTCALLATGAVKCWGDNDSGQLGDGTAWAETPASVPGLTDVAQPPDLVAPPTVAITTPQDGATYTQGAVVNASFTCTADTGATISSCVGTVANGAAINTTAGSHSFTVMAIDSLGKSTTISTSYTVTAATTSTPGGGDTPPGGAPITQNPPTKSLISGKPIVAKSMKSVKVSYVCAKTSCVITVTIRVAKKKYSFKSKPVIASSSTPKAQTISIPSKIVKKIKAAKKKNKKMKLKAAATIS